ncbi:hypothetical protein JKF63_06487 [Porcisia hertigi]|uniref:Major facilitator superfamily (MFS) profile domain-containing protein n=1 Tax=Porcisia hertigi TaxID=2761500 RepID=A0A836IY19_9TRYP|nr:hypothetical protein JKF63_06487 [Porcisia hertigi]
MHGVSNESALLQRGESSNSAPQACGGETVVEIGMSPRSVLWTFTLINFLLFFDRGAIAGALSSIRIDSHLIDNGTPLSDAKSGLLISGFTIGYVFSSPLFTSRGIVWGSKAIIGLGLAIWCLASVTCAASLSYASVLICRILVGVAEAAFVGFTVTIIDTIAPYGSRASWLGLFFSAIPIGTAAGIGCGGALSSYSTLWGLPPWRVVLVVQALAALPVIGLVFYMPNRYHLAPATGSTSHISFFAATSRVLCNKNYILLVLGFSVYCFLMGAVSTWGIPLLHEGPLQFSHTAAAVFMGLATAFSGAVGSLLGGLFVDRFGGSTGIAGAMHCQRFNILMMCFAIPSGVVALYSTHTVVFGITFLASVLAFFTITAPINACILTMVPPSLRPYAASYSTFFIHLLGDFPSPTVTGLLSDFWGRNCRGRSRDACSAAEPSLQCAWITDVEGGGRCVCRIQMRNALLIVFAYTVVALPCWTVVWQRLRREVRAADVLGEDVVESTSTVTPNTRTSDHLCLHGEV